MRKGTHHTQEAREKIRRALFGTHPSLVTIEKLRQANLGKPGYWTGKVRSPETREKLREANLGKPGYWTGKCRSPEAIEKMRRAKLGTHHTQEAREKIRRAKLGKPSGMLGKHSSPETIEKNRQAHLGEKNSNWHGGSSFEPYSTAWTEDLKESIRKRDKYSCQLCGRQQAELKKKLDIHHIDYDKKNLDTENLVSLCHCCHGKTNHKRKDWQIFFLIMPLLNLRVDQ